MLSPLADACRVRLLLNVDFLLQNVDVAFVYDAQLTSGVAVVKLSELSRVVIWTFVLPDGLDVRDAFVGNGLKDSLRLVVAVVLDTLNSVLIHHSAGHVVVGVEVNGCVRMHSWFRINLGIVVMRLVVSNQLIVFGDDTVLLPHHFNCSLSTFKVKLVILVFVRGLSSLFVESLLDFVASKLLGGVVIRVGLGLVVHGGQVDASLLLLISR